ncbi:MAG: hypothetical protein OHK0053_20360 [Microscillaceae bacterium]
MQAIRKHLFVYVSDEWRFERGTGFLLLPEKNRIVFFIPVGKGNFEKKTFSPNFIHIMARIGGYRAGGPASDAKRKTNKLDALPPVVDLRKYLSSIEFQVGNSCVANAFAGAYEYLAKRHLGEAADVSRLFIYYNARAEMGEKDQDEGSLMSAAIEVLKKYGLVRSNSGKIMKR